MSGSQAYLLRGMVELRIYPPRPEHAAAAAGADPADAEIFQVRAIGRLEDAA